MDQAAALLAALEAAASLGDAKFDPPRVEALAGAIGLEREKLPALVSQLQKAAYDLWCHLRKMLEWVVNNWERCEPRHPLCASERPLFAQCRCP